MSLPLATPDCISLSNSILLPEYYSAADAVAHIHGFFANNTYGVTLEHFESRVNWWKGMCVSNNPRHLDAYFEIQLYRNRIRNPLAGRFIIEYVKTIGQHEMHNAIFASLELYQPLPKIRFNSLVEKCVN